MFARQLLAVAALAAAPLTVTVPAGCARPVAARSVAARPELAPAPSPPLLTADLTVVRTGPRGTAQSIRVRPDGQWVFTPSPDSAWARVLNYGRLDPTQHARLAALLADPALPDEAARPAGSCPGGYRYQLDAGALDADWSDCEAADRPTLDAVLTMLTVVEPAF